MAKPGRHDGAAGEKQELELDVVVVLRLRGRLDRRQLREVEARERERVCRRRRVVDVDRMRRIEHAEAPELLALQRSPGERARHRRVVLRRADNEAASTVHELEHQREEE